MIGKLRAWYGDPDYFRDIFHIAGPIALQQLAFAGLNMLGVVFVGQKGETAVAAVGLAGQIAFLLNLVHFGIVSGSAMFTAQFWGKQDIPNLRRVLGLCLLLALSASLVFLLLAQFLPESILRIYSRDEAVIALGAEYMRVFSWTFLFFGITTSFGMVMRSTGNVRLPTAVSVTALVSSTFLSYGLIFGQFGLPELGVIGAAVSAVIARGLECLGILAVVYGTGTPVAASLRELFGFDLGFLRRVIRPVFPVILNEFFWASGITAYNAIYGRLGTESFAAINIVSSVEQVAFTVFIAISHATAVTVGNRIGAGRPQEAYRYAGRSIGIGILGGLAFGAALQVLKSPILSLYNVSPAVLHNAGLLFNVVSVFLWTRINNMTIVVGILRAGGDTKYSMFLDGIIIWIVGVPLAAAAAFLMHLPVQLVYLCAMTEEAVKWILGVRRWRSRKWITDLTARVQAA